MLSRISVSTLFSGISAIICKYQNLFNLLHLFDRYLIHYYYVNSLGSVLLSNKINRPNAIFDANKFIPKKEKTKSTKGKGLKGFLQSCLCEGLSVTD